MTHDGNGKVSLTRVDRTLVATAITLIVGLFGTFVTAWVNSASWQSTVATTLTHHESRFDRNEQQMAETRREFLAEIRALREHVSHL